MAVIAIPVEQVMPGDVLDVAGQGFVVDSLYDSSVEGGYFWLSFVGIHGGGVPVDSGVVLNVQRTTLESTLRETLIAEFLKADWLDPESDTDDVDRFVDALGSAIAERFTVEPK